MNGEDTLLDRINEIVDEVHIDEVKQIIMVLSKINKLKNSIEEELSETIFYKKILKELRAEFGTFDFKIVHIKNNYETILYQEGDVSSYEYCFEHLFSNQVKINMYIANKKFSKYELISLNTYFKELVHLLYIQFVLLDFQKSANIDPLTSLKNRTSFNIEMETLVPLALRENMKIGVILINIDRFRAVNDEHGNQFGDKFLKLYAKTIQKHIRTSDIAVRFGGGEFLVLLINVVSEEMTIEIAKKLKTKLSNTSLTAPNNDKFRKTVSIGVSMFPEDSKDINEIVRFSEIALADAQEKGRNCLSRYEKSQPGAIEFF